MLKENQLVATKVHGKTKEHYKNLGYEFKKCRETIYVKINDLPKGSNVEVIVICDYCGEEITRTYQDYLHHHDKELGDTCKKCAFVKNKHTNLKRYGVEIPIQNKDVANKMKETMLNKYGVEYAMQSEQTKDKMKETNMDRYGYENAMQSPLIKEKAKESCLDKYGVEWNVLEKDFKSKSKETTIRKYGVEYAMQSPMIREKMKNTLMENHGVYSPSHSPIIREKIMRTLFKNGTQKTSKQQLILNNMLKSLYGESELNKPCDKFSLDCAINVNEVKIDVEYDGWYWHKNQQKDKDKERDNFLINDKNYKVLRVRSGKLLPTEKQLKVAINCLINSDIKYKEIILEDWEK